MRFGGRRDGERGKGKETDSGVHYTFDVRSVFGRALLGYGFRFLVSYISQLHPLRLIL